MELQFLGTGAGVPAKHRNVSSIALKLLAEINEVWLFDCGEGTQMQILKTAIRPRKIKKIFITHLHGDHIFGLPGLLSSRSFQGGEEKALSDVDIYGPVGIRAFVQNTLKFSSTHLAYKIRYHEIQEPCILLESDKFKVTTLPLEHGVACFGYRIVEKDHEGELQVEKLKEKNIPPGPIYAKIKAGEVVELADGRIIDGKDYVGEKRAGRIVTILGDTRFTENAKKLAEYADVFVHEATYEKGQEKMARKHYHSTTTQAALIAKEAQAKKLLLTHISARYMMKDQKRLVMQAQEIFPNTQMMRDLEEVEIPFER